MLLNARNQPNLATSVIADLLSTSSDYHQEIEIQTKMLT